MDRATAIEFLNMFEILECPYVCDVELSYVQELLLIPSPHRTRILYWLFFTIDSDVQKMVEIYENNPNIPRSSEIDGKVQLITQVAAALGLCTPYDFDLIRGAASISKHISFWKNILSIASNLCEHGPEHVHDRFHGISLFLEKTLRTGSVAEAFATTLQVLPPALERELNMSLKTIKTSKSNEDFSTEEISNKIESLESQLQEQSELLTRLLDEHDYREVNTDEKLRIDKLTRTMALLLGDLHQLQTCFTESYDHFFQPYCDKSPVKFSGFGSRIQAVGRQLSSYLELMENLTKTKESRKQIASLQATERKQMSENAQETT